MILKIFQNKNNKKLLLWKLYLSTCYSWNTLTHVACCCGVWEVCEICQIVWWVIQCLIGPL